MVAARAPEQCSCVNEMNLELEVIAGFIERARCPEDAFGNVHGSLTAVQAQLTKAYKQLAKTVHPDLYTNGGSDTAEKAFKKLNELRDIAIERLMKGTYGLRLPLPGMEPVVLAGKYIREVSLCSGDIADLHVGSIESSSQRANILIKIARKHEDNDLLLVEQDVLKRLHNKLQDHLWKQCVPEVKDSFLLNEGSYHKRRVNILDNFTGFYDAVNIRKLVGAVDTRSIVWMWKRLLLLLDWTHHTGFIHGAVLPPHVMYFPDNYTAVLTKDNRKHSVRLVDWCYAVEYKKRTRLTAWLPEYKDFYAPEVLAKQPLSPATDIYMGAKTMLYLLGSTDVKNNQMPNHIPTMMKTHFLGCLTGRMNDAAACFDHIQSVALTLFGRPKYHDFNLPI